MYVLCAHEDLITIELKNGFVSFCSVCHLSDTTPPLTSSGAGELLPWWDHKPVAKELIDAKRPAINRWHALRHHLREQITLIEDLLAWEEEIGESSDLALVAELNDLQEQEAMLVIPWPTHV